MIVIDSDVLIDALRGRKRAKERVALELRTGDIATTTVNVFELASGARTQEERDKVHALLAPFRVLPFDRPAAREAAEARRQLEAAGQRIGMADFLIAGICLSRNAILVTRNREHFARVPGLNVSTFDPDG